MKKIVFAICAGFAALLFSAGCAGIKETHASLNEAVSADDISTFGFSVVKNKTTKQDIFRAIGAPGLVFKNDINGETWVYNRVAVRQSDVAAQVSGNFNIFFPYSGSSMSKGGGVAGVKAGTGMTRFRSSYKSAGLLIHFNANGCLNSYEFTATSF